MCPRRPPEPEPQCMRHIDALQEQFAQTPLASRASSAFSGVPPQIIDRIVILITAFLLAQMSE